MGLDVGLVFRSRAFLGSLIGRLEGVLDRIGLDRILVTDLLGNVCDHRHHGVGAFLGNLIWRLERVLDGVGFSRLSGRTASECLPPRHRGFGIDGLIPYVSHCLGLGD